MLNGTNNTQAFEDFTGDTEIDEGRSYEVRLKRAVEHPPGTGHFIQPDATTVRITGVVVEQWGADYIGSIRPA